MKKFIALLLVATVVVVAGFADPIGLKVYIDGFGFGNVAGDTYKFAGTGGEGNITPGIEYNRALGPIAFNTSLQDKFTFSEPLGQDLRWHVRGTYALQVAEASKLSFFLYNRLHFKGANEEFANTDYDLIIDDFGPGIRFDQTLDFGGLYAEGGINFKIHTGEATPGAGKELEIGTSDTDHIRLGVSTKLGLYGSVNIKMAFRNAKGDTPDDIVTEIDPRIGYVYGPIDGRVTFTIPTVKDGIDTKGITIQPRVTYNNIIPGLAAYADFAIVAGKKDGKIGFTPTIGVSYAF